ncbi:MAG: DUF6152 family protein [Gammaproteobacteria bacterium]|jgi:hypothetical protein
MLRRLLIIAAGAGAVPASAHHSTVAIFDSSRTIELTGVIESLSWRNPHGQIVLAVEDASGNVVEWEAETAGVSVMRNRGAPTDVFAVGDVITLAGSPARRGNPEILARSVLLPSGYEFNFGSGAQPYFPAGKNGNMVGRAAGREGDVAAAIEAADGIYRVWSTIMSDPAAFPMFKGGYPLTASAEAGLADWNPVDNELLRCGTKGMPLIMITPFPIEFVREGENIRMLIEEYDARRLIHMSPDATPPSELTQMGYSRGRFEGNTLVVETDHITPAYFDPDGVRHSEQLHLVERFIPNDDYTRLDYVLSVTDPETFTEEFELTRYFIWRPGDSVHPYECLERY